MGEGVDLVNSETNFSGFRSYRLAFLLFLIEFYDDVQACHGMKRIIISSIFITVGLMCEAQIFKDTLYRATAAEREMYRNAIKKGRGQKALGCLVFLGGGAVTA